MGVDVNWCGLVVVVVLAAAGSQHLQNVDVSLRWIPIMGTKMKGLLKGLHKISNIFDAKDDQEMQIGFPTDVKHVAHIGWDGPSVDSSPGWMNDFSSANSAPLPATANNGSGNEPTTTVLPKWSSEDYGTAANGSSAKPSKRNTSSDAPSTDGEPSAVPKQSRRHKSSSDPPPSRGESSEESRRGRRERKTSAGSGGSDSSTSSTAAAAAAAAAGQDASGIPKQSRRKKVAKGSSEGSVRSSRSKATASSDKGSEQLPVSLLKPMKEDTDGEQE